jgi:PBP1b-binding outer membrane lipoprotein LpoB
MKKNILIIAITSLLLILAGCKTSPILNIENAPIVISAKHSSNDVKDAIFRAGIALDWKMKEMKGGHIVGTLFIRNHIAVVDIKYSKETYNIDYKSGTNLKYDGVNIHKNYNEWIQNLNRLIQKNLSKI